MLLLLLLMLLLNLRSHRCRMSLCLGMRLRLRLRLGLSVSLRLGMRLRLQKQPWRHGVHDCWVLRAIRSLRSQQLRVQLLLLLLLLLLHLHVRQRRLMLLLLLLLVLLLLHVHADLLVELRRIKTGMELRQLHALLLVRQGGGKHLVGHHVCMERHVGLNRDGRRAQHDRCGRLGNLN